MSHQRTWILGGALLLLAGAVVLVALSAYYADLPETVDDLETIVLG